MLYCRIECCKMWVAQYAVWMCMLLLHTPTPALAKTQNNLVCQKTHVVEERVAVPIQEPATFRSYTWCLKVPPRCSKYTVISRERVEYKIEVRNVTVNECCEGAVRLHGSCVRACPACDNMLCDVTRNCTCAPGFLGPLCNQTCEPGRWGDRCAEACVCRVGEDCDHISGICNPSRSTVPPSTQAPPAAPTTKPAAPTMKPAVTTTKLSVPTRPATTTTPRPPPSHRQTPTTANTFINLTLTEPTTSSEDLTDFNMISRPRANNSVRLTNGNDDNSLNALGDLDYPILPTDSIVESFDLQPEYEPTKNIVLNTLTGNGSAANDRWISELSSPSGVTLGSALALLALLIVVVGAVIRCRNKRSAKHQGLPLDSTSLHLVARNSHYAVPGPPTFSFINAYSADLITKEMLENSYDHPRSVRCLVNEPVYDELRY